MIRTFKTLEEYYTFTNNGQDLKSGDIYIIEGTEKLYFLTNNIDGKITKYEYLDDIPEGYILPTGNISITENGTDIDVNDYATASVNVPIPEGYIVPSGDVSITQNGSNIDVNDYATATVNVPIPEGYIRPTGNKSITENGENIDVTEYASASVNVPIPEGYIVPTGNISLTENGTNIDIAQYATATVNVTEDLINLIERDITSIDIPSGTTTIGNFAFRDCTGLTSITIPNTVTSIGNNAFKNCTGLTSITIPNTVTSIEQSVFEDCSGLTSITIPNTVTSIDKQAFNHCGILTSITIPDSLTSIGERAFGECTGLTTVTIPNSVTSIDQYAFYKCTGLTSVTIGNGITSIGSTAFYGCTSLTSVTITATTPPTLGAVNAFGDTHNCPIFVPAASVEDYKAATNWTRYASRIQGYETRVVVKFNVYDTSSPIPIISENATNQIDDIEIDGVAQQSVVSSYTFSTTGEHTVKYTFKNNTIGAAAFRGCYGLTSVTIPDNITSIGDEAFNNCGLKSVTIGNGVTSIGDNAFYDNNELSDVTIGSGVTSIGDSAFSYIELSLSFTIKATTPPSLNSRAFYETWYFDGIYVPAASVSDYQNASNWSNYASNIKAIPTT